MFSLFELDNISEDTLLKQFSNVKGENEFETRANIALILKDEENLKDCPLFDENNADNFFELLLMDLETLRSYWQKQFKKNPLSEEFTRKHRILCIYMLQANIIIINYHLIRKSKIQTLYEDPVYYDESYYDALESLSDDDLEIFDNFFRYSDKPYVYYNIYKEIAKRIYDRVKYGIIKTILPRKIDICLGVLAIQRKDSLMIYALNRKLLSHNDKSYYKEIYNFYPVIEALQYVQAETIQVLELALAAISSVTKMSPYEHISYEQFIETLKFLWKTSGQGCRIFFDMCSRHLEKERSQRFILAARVRLCENGTTIGKLASKYTSLSYIPADKYI